MRITSVPALLGLSSALFALSMCTSRASVARAEAPLPEALPVPEPSAPPPSRDDGDGRSRPADDTRRDHFRIGALVGVGFPRPLEVGGLMKVERVVSLGLEYSVLPSTTFSGVETSFWALAGDLRVFPMRGPFFLGLRAGRQHLGAKGSVNVGVGQTITGAVAVDTIFLNPRLGFLWTFHSGISLGIDAGFQIPVSAKVSGLPPGTENLMLPAGATSLDRQVVSTAKYIGKSTLPTVDLFRIGVLL